MPEGSINPIELETLVREIVTTLDGGIAAGDVRLFVELTELTSGIATLRREIGLLQPDSILVQDIPSANDELDAIVAATETATGEILDSVEKIESIGASLGGEPAQAIADAVTRIYEACNFQDITGQRITKVVRTFQSIEQKLTALLDRVGGGDRAPASAPAVAPPPSKSDAPLDEKALLNGPALPGGGTSQEEIDKLLASFD
jgi:chemotaxis protein CheZ